MAHVPNRENAHVPIEKLRDYLLSPVHPVGRLKAAYFVSLGYTQDNWLQLEQDLRQVLTNDVARVERTTFGVKYVVYGTITSPSGKTARIVTVWVIRSGEETPRFVTAFPGAMP
ncbi:hypothetical protein JXA88_16595 [Candidatus Fermentibacteria bacterium]|nr:hypothetical protein [Candidatus Fermentibacteria bacterium]